jgi:hypothetical protein
MNELWAMGKSCQLNLEFSQLGVILKAVRSAILPACSKVIFHLLGQHAMQKVTW